MGVALVSGACGLSALGGGAPAGSNDGGLDGMAGDGATAGEGGGGDAAGDAGDDGGSVFLGDAAVGGRTTRGLVALYLLRETSGLVAHDSLAPPLDLSRVTTAGPDFDWDPTGLTFFGNGSELASPLLTPTKITTACKASNEVTAEAWVTPTTASQKGPARILALSNGISNQSIMLGIGEDGDADSALARWIFRLNRTGGNRTIFESNDSVVTTKLQHVVVTAKQNVGLKFYVDTMEIPNTRNSDVPEGFGGWIDSNSFRFGSELGTNDRRFRGTISLAAIYCVALTTTEIAANYAAGARP